MNISLKITIGFVLIIVLSGLSFFVNHRLSAEVNRNTEFLTSSEAIIRNSAQIHKKIIDMQGAFRGYLLTSNENFLLPYYQGVKEVPALFKEEKVLIEDSPVQRNKLDSIEKIHYEWIEYANTLIEAKKRTISSSFNFSKDYLYLFENKLQKEVGKKMNDEIAVKFKEFDAHEYKVRQARRERLTQSIATTGKVSITLAIITLTLGIASAVYITHIISRRITKMVNLADGISRGKFDTINDTANDEMTKLSLSLNLMSEKLNKSFKDLGKKNKELDQFAYVVSHDLKAPLRGMYNIINWIQEDLGQELSGDLKKYMEMLKGRIERLESLISGLLEYARIGRVAKEKEEVDVRELLIEIGDMVVPADFQMKIKEPMPVLFTEKIRLQQVFTNLISNAVKYHGGSNGTVTVECVESDVHYKFSVSDNGVGIEPEYHEKIFKIFQTLREKNESESTGIGLAIVKKIIEDNKGNIKVISDKGKGARFEFTWPKELIKEKVE